VRLLERLQRRRRTGAADDPEVPVDLVRGRELTCERSVVGCIEWWEHPLRDLAADCAEVGNEAGCRRPAEAVVVDDDRRLPPPQLLVGDLTGSRVPHCAVPVIAE